MCSICSFTSLISPFESTLEDWEVMSSILTHDRMKKSNFLRRFQLFRHLTESKMCSICSFTSLIYPFESTLEDWEVMSSILTHDRMKKSNFLRRFQLFRHLTESKMCSICSFISLISPFESTLEDWEVMSSILTHDSEKIKFSQRFQLLRHHDRS